ncbi:flagellar biosynthetic protein FliR [Cohaesibacter sp. ES.047]|uniref:flagellar biosynthetic protein FliR n=1 Tax=Cohaesibacter sp. ES.047 TaxID=1798205 RepID=UPI000BB797A4|nr:flagellar biosynthetic protein FliR [Cohaesibacter sp. ES.047]SNY92159.1 flagellar biosynthetic protein FliR [Cohaesibacter sp. ES.047]
MFWLQPNTLVAVFLIFCRIGACLMIVPGFSSARVSPSIRLFIALSLSLALSPLLVAKVLPTVTQVTSAHLMFLIAAEILIGATIGFIGRVFIAALQTMGSFAAMSMNLSGMAGAPIEDSEPVPALVNLMTLTAITLIFISGLHWQIIDGLVSSYSAVPPAMIIDAQDTLIQATDALREAFLLALRIASPFVIYAVVVNLALGLTNKLTPQIPVYFIAMPFVIAGGLFLMMFVIGEMMGIFVDHLSQVLSR